MAKIRAVAGMAVSESCGSGGWDDRTRLMEVVDTMPNWRDDGETCI